MTISKVLYDFTIQMNRVFQASTPDIIVQDHIDHIWNTDITVPGDSRTKENKREKMKKY